MLTGPSQIQSNTLMRVLHAPNLRVMTMRGVCVGIQSDALRSLIIDFTTVDRLVRPSLEYIRSTLQRVSHCLEELSLCHAVGLCIADPSPVILPALTVLRVDGTSIEAQCILDRLRVPPSALRLMRFFGTRGQIGGLDGILASLCMCLRNVCWMRR